MRFDSVLKVLGTACMLVGFGTGCATNVYPGGPSVGASIFANVTAPAQMLTVATDANAKPVKVGRATSSAVFGIVAAGDGGLNAAMKDGGITRVHHVDHNIKLFAYGIYVSDTVIVHGE